jgi:Mce-associated membrane protein
VDAAALRRLAARRARAAAAREAMAPDQGAETAAPEKTTARVETAAQEAIAERVATESREETGLWEEGAAQDETAPREDTGQQEVGDAADDPDDATHPGGPGHSRPALRLIAVMALAVATLVFGGLAAWFGTEAGSLNGEPSAQNQALANPSETSRVTSQVTSAINALFSYNYAEPGSTTKAASRVLTGAAVKEYAALFAEVKEKAPKEKLIITTKVSSAGVELLTPDAARVLVFATESDGSAGASTPSTAGAMLAVNMVRDGGTWKISGIDTFSG